MALDPLVVALVLMAAILHASWNALTKSSSDPLLAIWLMTSTAGLMGGIGVFFVDAPEPASWPYLGTAVLLRLGYMLFLVHAYGLGDLSRVYPIARGLAPVLVAVLAAVVAEERPSVLQALGLLLCCGSIASLAFADAGTAGLNGRAVRSAAITGVFIGLYTVVDGVGIRLVGDPYGYVAWTFLLDVAPISIAVLTLRRGMIRAHLRTGLWRGVAGGAMGAVAYGIVLWALSRGAMGSVASLRETSVVFATWIGARVLGEPLGARRMVAAMLVAVGLIIWQR